jgi:hypothetical protein
MPPSPEIGWCDQRWKLNVRDRARRIAYSFEMGVATAHGVMLRPGERLIR